jgi:Dynamin family
MITESSLSRLLLQALTSVAEPTAEQERLIRGLKALTERLAAQELRIAVLGQFKRGKSSLLNALLGTRVLPMGITPITAIPTFIHSEPRDAIRILRRGTWEEPIVSNGQRLADVVETFVSEARNPNNRLEVEEVHVGISAPFLADNVVYIDTPGIGSTLEHNTKAAEAVLSKCDAGLFVVSADPPITEAELHFLGRIRVLVPRLIFVLNKSDLLSNEERDLARDFLLHVLTEQASIHPPVEIYLVSARDALSIADNNGKALVGSGLVALRSLIADVLALEKQGILLEAAARRARIAVAELRFQSELRLNSLLLPLEELSAKITIFEQSSTGFEAQRCALADSMMVDKQRLFRDLESDTDRLWEEARGALRAVFDKYVGLEDPAVLQGRLAKEISEYFDRAFAEFVKTGKANASERLSTHQRHADSLIEAVRRSAAELLDIAVPRLEPADVFRMDREPYWVTPEPARSLLSYSAAPFSRVLPRKIRERRARRQQLADLDRAILRNVANLDWAMRQNIEEAFRRFGTSLREELDHALHATRSAMQVALDRHTLHEYVVAQSVQDATSSTESLSHILRELEAMVSRGESKRKA